MNDPGLGSTYRVQVQTLGFTRTRFLVPYLAALGIQTLYLSPVLAAAPHSSHGYDVVDPGRLEPDLGTEQDLEALFDELQTYGMRALLDIVPNHMAAVPENAWWWDVLRRGKESPYASTFDIHWSEQQGRVLVPVLNRPLADVIGSGALAVDQEKGELTVDGIRFPLNADSLDGDDAATLRHQHYRPAYWRVSAAQGNYRRFFDINSLIGVRVEDPDVFDATHLRIEELSRHPAVAGVRVDHVDGLTDPLQYLQRLRDRIPDEKAIVVEKILGQEELLDPAWPVDGTTGYEFADRLMGLFIDSAGAARIRVAGEAFCGLGETTFAALAQSGKRHVLGQSFCAEVDYLTRLSIEVLDAELPGHDLSEHDIRRAWTELTVALPTYRTYIDDHGASETDRASIETAGAEQFDGPQARRALELLRSALCGQARAGSPWLVVAHRWQQLSGATMAKGSEDTATYRYPGLLARADVGGDPDSDVPVAEFHAFAAARVGDLNTTSTHDSKRNEDARCRLAVLSEADSEWVALVRRWGTPAAPDDGDPVPIEQLAMLQTLLCLWPPQGDELDGSALERAVAQAIKSARESKLRSSWTEPDEAYEEGLGRYVRRLHGHPEFRKEMTAFSSHIGPAAFVNSISSVVLKVCAPGIPDFYQGTDLVEPILTDPDNRRAVDFALRADILAALPEPSVAAAGDLLSHWHDGHLKMFVMRAVLLDRMSAAALYARGSYEPLSTTTRHAIAFRRSLDGEGSLICIVPRLSYLLAGPGTFPTGRPVWREDLVNIPGHGSTRYRDLLTDRVIEAGPEGAPLSAVLDVLPVAVLRAAS